MRPIDADALIKALVRKEPFSDCARVVIAECMEEVRHAPTIEPEIKEIGYQDCSNAVLKMWIDNDLTDGEYNRIMDKLNAHWGKTKNG